MGHVGVGNALGRGRVFAVRRSSRPAAWSRRPCRRGAVHAGRLQHGRLDRGGLRGGDRGQRHPRSRPRVHLQISECRPERIRPAEHHRQRDHSRQRCHDQTGACGTAVRPDDVFGTLVIDHVALTGGNTTNDGGAIRAVGASSVTLTDSTVDGNTAVLGGGIFFNTGSYFVTRSTISGNTATTAAAYTTTAAPRRSPTAPSRGTPSPAAPAVVSTTSTTRRRSPTAPSWATAPPEVVAAPTTTSSSAAR